MTEHECDAEGSVDIDICKGCGDHAGFCSWEVPRETA